MEQIMTSFGKNQYIDENSEEFSERFTLEWTLPALIGGLATETTVLLGGMSEITQAGIGVGVFVLLHKVLQKFDILEHRGQH
jgi:ABC-type branched-subunit amino acid transport system permease subunit